MTPMRCVVASGNAGKLLELTRLLQPLGLLPLSQGDFGIEAPPEPFPGFVENALVKARHASRIAGMPAIADDSGICVPALGGEPGVYSARYAERGGYGSGDAANNRLLADRLAGMAPEADSPLRSATYVCVLVWVDHAEDPLPLIAQGLWHGRFVTAGRGEGGFGYDPHFLLPDLGVTVAELPVERKNALSHRAQAMRQLAIALRDRRTQVATDGSFRA